MDKMREALINKYARRLTRCESIGYYAHLNEILDEYTTSQQPKCSHTWVSCAERLPTEEGRYAVIVNNPYLDDKPFTDCADFKGGKWLGMFRAVCTHWMELPEPPAEEA